MTVVTSITGRLIRKNNVCPKKSAIFKTNSSQNDPHQEREFRKGRIENGPYGSKECTTIVWRFFANAHAKARKIGMGFLCNQE